jgi:Fur family ferric uptake transcriptional regulator
MASKSLEFLPNKPSDVLRSILNQEGFRLTDQRQKILNLFETTFVGQHLSAEEIQQYLAQQGQNISYSTIYRALHVMVNLGLLRELELSDERKFYELNHPLVEHHHLVCVDCGTVREFGDDSIAQVSRQAAKSQGFALLNDQFTIYGTCPQCQRRRETSAEY